MTASLRPDFLRRLIRAVLPRAVRNWLRSPSRSLRWIADEVAFRAGRTTWVSVPDNQRIRCHPTAARVAFQPAVADPAQRAELVAFLTRVPPEGLVLDIGAHFGLFALTAVVNQPGARVVAVDASGSARRMLIRHADLNGVKDRLAVVHAAVGAAEGFLELVDAGLMAAGYLTSPTADHPPAERTVVRSTTVDALARQYGAPDLLKIDVEGYEMEVLRGAEETLSTTRPVIALELHNTILRQAGQAPESVLDFLQAHQYACHAVDGSTMSIHEASAHDVTRLMALST